MTAAVPGATLALYVAAAGTSLAGVAAGFFRRRLGGGPRGD